MFTLLRKYQGVSREVVAFFPNQAEYKAARDEISQIRVIDLDTENIFNPFWDERFGTAPYGL